MRQFCRITFRFAWDRVDSKLINLSCGSRRQNDAESQFCEKGKPERIILILVQYTGDSDGATRRIFFVKRFITKIAFQFVCEQVRHFIFGLCFSKSAFTTVSGDEFPSAAEMTDRQTAVVRTAFALGQCCGIFQRLDLINGKHCGSLTFYITFPCDQRSAESAHDAGDIRTDGFTPRDLFKTAQYGVIVESTALYDDMISEFGGVGNFDHLKQRIFDNGICKSG